MRTTIDMPDQLLARVKRFTAERNTTFRALVIDALEKVLEPPLREFRLRDASVGLKPQKGKGLDSDAINQAIDAQRESSFTP
jgi:Arc/MetJ family transcription regulator